MSKRKYITIEGPDTFATVDLLNPPDLRDASIIITREKGTLRIVARVLNTGGDTWEEKEIELDLTVL